MLIVLFTLLNNTGKSIIHVHNLNELDKTIKYWVHVRESTGKIELEFALANVPKSPNSRSAFECYDIAGRFLVPNTTVKPLIDPVPFM